MSNTRRYMKLSVVSDTGGEIRWSDYGPRALKHQRVRYRVGDGSRAWDISCRRFQCRWIDRLTTIQVGGSLAGDDSPELVVDSEAFSFENFPKISPFFLSKSSPRL